MNLEWTDQAIDEFLAAINKHLTKTTKAKFAGDIDKRIGNLKRYPEFGRVIPEFNEKHKRELIYKGYRIKYIISDNIYIAHIVKPGKKVPEI